MRRKVGFGDVRERFQNRKLYKRGIGKRERRVIGMRQVRKIGSGGRTRGRKRVESERRGRDRRRRIAGRSRVTGRQREMTLRNKGAKRERRVRLVGPNRSRIGRNVRFTGDRHEI